MSAWTECKVARIKHMIETRIGRRASRGEDGGCLLDTESVTVSRIMTPRAPPHRDTAPRTEAKRKVF